MPGSRQHPSRPPVPPDALFKRDLAVVTDRQYGERVGIYRLLELFHDLGIKTTFFINGINAERFPDMIRWIENEGHEIASENYIHDYSYMKTYEQEREDLRKTVRAIETVLGAKPMGYLSTGVRPTDNTPMIIADEGYLYWADLQHEDLPYTLVVNGKKLVVIQYQHYLNDYSTYTSSERAPRDLLSIWKDNFDFIYRKSDTYPNMMIWGNHPFLMGRPYRARVLEEFLKYAKEFSGVWFARCLDIARWWRENHAETHVETWPNYATWPEDGAK